MATYKYLDKTGLGQVWSKIKNYINNNFLSKTNTTAYTPTTDYHPATKKYVDDSVPTVPTKVSQLTNDSGYISSYTETDPIFTASAAHGITSTDISNWNSKTSNTGTITKIQTTAGAHTTINVSSGSAAFNVPTKTSHLTNDSGFITDAGVTGVKGNSESSYRTGQVNLTASNIGAVATSGNETIAGNKTFSGTTTLSAESVYPATQNTILTANAEAIIQSPIPKYLWHDIIAFCKATTPTFYTTTNGTTWTAATLEKRLFAHMNNWGNQQVLNSSIQGSRWIWHNGGFAYSSLSWIILGITYNANIATFDLLLETTADATASSPTWTTLCSITGAKYNQQPIWIKATGPSSTGDLRLTITRTSGDTTTNVLPLCSIEFLTTRWGDQGKGSEFEYPYNWDGIPNIYPIQNDVSNLGTSSNKWANVYATTFTGNLTGNVTGNVSGSAGSVAWSGVGSKPTTLAGYGITDAKIASGVITLGSNTITPLTASSTLDATKLSGIVPTACLPSYVDDVLEYSAKSSFPATGETGKIYVDTTTNLTYRWGGSAYVEISPSLALGTTSSTAFRGDYGNSAYTHAVTNKGSAFSSGFYKITTNSEGHVTGATAVQKSDITRLGIPAQDTTYTFDGTYNASTNKAATVSTVNNALVNTALTGTTTAELIYTDELTTGNLIVNGGASFVNTISVGSAPTSDMNVATKKYVDDSIDASTFYINITLSWQGSNPVYTSDKTFSQIETAFEAGKNCIVLLTTDYIEVLQLLIYDEYNGFYFGNETSCILISTENSISSSSNYLQLTYNGSNDTWTSNIAPRIFEPTNGKTWVSINDGQYQSVCSATLTTDISGLTTTKKLTFAYQGQFYHLISTNGTTWTKDNTIVDNYSLALNNNVIQLKNGNTVISSVTLPVYNGGVNL